MGIGMASLSLPRAFLSTQLLSTLALLFISIISTIGTSSIFYCSAWITPRKIIVSFSRAWASRAQKHTEWPTTNGWGSHSKHLLSSPPFSPSIPSLLLSSSPLFCLSTSSLSSPTLFSCFLFLCPSLSHPSPSSLHLPLYSCLLYVLGAQLVLCSSQATDEGTLWGTGWLQSLGTQPPMFFRWASLSKHKEGAWLWE